MTFTVHWNVDVFQANYLEQLRAVIALVARSSLEDVNVFNAPFKGQSPKFEKGDQSPHEDYRRLQEPDGLEIWVEILAASSMVEQIKLQVTSEQISRKLLSRGLLGISSIGLLSCPGGILKTSNGSSLPYCSPCPANSYCLEGSTETMSCFPESTSPGGSDSVGDCVCAAGMYRGYNDAESVVSTLTGGVSVNSGTTRTLVDGNKTQARFLQPSGISANFDESIAVVADTGNHAVRMVNLTTGDTFTIGGHVPSGVPQSGYVDGGKNV